MTVGGSGDRAVAAVGADRAGPRPDGWTFQDDHFLHFSTRTLPRLLARHGFRTLEIHTSRWRDFHDRLSDRPAWFRAVNRVVERLGMRIEVFCLARPER